jgi:thiol:disulfide interchange protein DsbG
VLAKIKANGALMERFDSQGTPTIAWKEKDGKVQTLSGMPRLSALPGITGLPEQKIDDADLAQFK